jgi:DsbC/DsbD-like thiol-disulfide interchange protein
MLPLAALLLTGLPYLAAQGSGHLTVGSPAKISGARNASVQTRIPVTIDPGFHVNSNPAAADYLIPLSVTWSATGALQAGTVTYPKATKEKVGDDTLTVYTGSFDLIANFKVSATAPAGPGVAAGKLRYQACNSNTCFPPKNVEISVAYQIQ